MKKVIISVVSVCIIAVLIVVSVIYFRGANQQQGLTKEQQEAIDKAEQEMKDTASAPGQEGEPDSASEQLAETIHVKPENVVSVGKPVKRGQLEITVDSWEMTKEKPPYEMPEDIDLTWRGGQVDSSNNFINGYSYVVVNVTAKNTGSKEFSRHLWGEFRLQITHTSTYLGEPTWIGQTPMRERTKSYYLETIQPGAEVSLALIFILEDSLLDGEDLYIKINPNGTQTVDPDYDTRRFIVLQLH